MGDEARPPVRQRWTWHTFGSRCGARDGRAVRSDYGAGSASRFTHHTRPFDFACVLLSAARCAMGHKLYDPL